jgi:Ca2+/Na+ antiporter
MAAVVACALDNQRRCLHDSPAMIEVQSGGRAGAEVLMIAGVTIQYVGTRVGLAALVSSNGPAPGRRAIAQWVPIMATALAAVVMGHPEMAVALVFGSSVACLSLVLGMSTYVGPLQEFPPSRRLWPLVLPPAIFALLAGFRGNLNWFHAVLLLVMGAAFLSLWVEQSPGNLGSVSAPEPERRGHVGWGLLLALGLAGIGAWAAGRGAIATSERSRLITSQLLAGTVLSPLLLLPGLGASSMLAQREQTGEAITALTGMVLLNLCLLLPIVILLNYALVGLFHASESRATPYPLIVWRVDTVMLVVLGFAIVPVAAGRWLPGRLESMLLVLAYAAYLVAETVVSARLF